MPASSIFGPDTVGAVTVPLAPGAAGQTPGDPCLWYLGSFLLAFLNTDQQASQGWTIAGVDPNDPPVKGFYVGRPDDEGFQLNTSRLPFLFVYRDTDKTEGWGEDWWIIRTQLKLVWVLPMGQPNAQVSRLPFRNAMRDAIWIGIERGRTPSWVQPGDPDANAASEGSLFWTFAGFAQLNLTGSRPASVRARGANGAPGAGPFPGIELTFELVERWTPGTANRPATLAAGGVDIKVQDTLGNTLAEGKPFAAPTITSLSPTSGTAAGGTSVTITGTGFRAGAQVTFGPGGQWVSGPAGAVWQPFGTPATSVVVVSATEITCTTPASGTTYAQAVDVVVTNNDGGFAVLPTGFSFTLP